ncbi:ABC transporter permease [Candidatus Gottesmanbacteria bacterium]|nr:ABC transporter permease [Candidatus Gottesmanbacteria bacterium]
MKLYRIIALLWRYIYLMKRELGKLSEVFYWPVMDVLIWGFVSIYLDKTNQQLNFFASLFLSGMILWNIFNNTSKSISVSLLDDIWSRNLSNLFASPLNPMEFLTATMFLSLFKIFATLLTTSFIALLFYSFNLFTLGISLWANFINLVIFGWSIGIITSALILRYGTKVEDFAWSMPWLFTPFAAVWYPVSILPGILRMIALILPVSYVFEGMRGVILIKTFLWDKFFWALGLNFIYGILAIWFFHKMFKSVKEKGLLTRNG